MPTQLKWLGFVRALQEIEQGLFWRIELTYIVVLKQKFVQFTVIEGRSGRNLLLLESCGFRHCITIKSRHSEAAVTRPEPGANYLMRVGFTSNCIGSGTQRGAPSGKSSHRQVKAAPKKMHRTGLADKAREKS